MVRCLLVCAWVWAVGGLSAGKPSGMIGKTGKERELGTRVSGLCPGTWGGDTMWNMTGAENMGLGPYKQPY